MARGVKKVREGVVEGGEILRGKRVAATVSKIGQVDAAGKYVLSMGYDKLIGEEGKGLSSVGLFLMSEISQMTWYPDVETQLADVEEFLKPFLEYRDRLRERVGEKGEPGV